MSGRLLVIHKSENNDYMITNKIFYHLFFIFIATMSEINYATAAVHKNDLKLLEDFAKSIVPATPVLPSNVATRIATGSGNSVSDFIVTGFDFTNYQRNVLMVQILSTTGNRLVFQQSVNGGTSYYRDSGLTSDNLGSLATVNSNQNETISAYNDGDPASAGVYRQNQLVSGQHNVTITPPVLTGTPLKPMSTLNFTLEVDRPVIAGSRQSISFRSNFIRGNGADGLVGFLEGTTSQYGNPGISPTHIKFGDIAGGFITYRWSLFGFP